MSKRKEQSMSFYQSIEDLPVYRWDKIKTTGDRRYLIVGWDGEEVEADLNDLWNDLQQEFEQRIGLSESGGYHLEKFLKLQRLIKDEIIYSCDEHHPKLSKTVTQRKILERELETTPHTQELEDQAIQLEIFFGRDFNTKTTSVLRWYKYLNEYEKRITQISKENKPQANV